MSTKQHYYPVVRNGKLTQRVQKILDEYKRDYNVDVVRTLQSEHNRLRDRILFLEVFEQNQEKVKDCKARIYALRQILDIIDKPVTNS